jgi:hypothetical protein
MAGTIRAGAWSPRSVRALLAGFLAVAALALILKPGEPPSGPASAESVFPLGFTANAGQTDPSVAYVSRGANSTVFFTRDRVVLDFKDGSRGAALQLRFRHANPSPAIVGEQRTGARMSYLVGAAGAGNLPTYAQLRYRDLWPGIDMVFRQQHGVLKYEFLVSPGADPSAIRLSYAGADGVRIGGGGELLVATSLGTLTDKRPLATQGGRDVDSRYVLSGATYGFALGAYDRTKPLLIDPGLVYSTFLGGTFGDDGAGLALDGAGNAYVSGEAPSADFPTTLGAYNSSSTRNDAFVAKFSPSGALLYSALIGGSGDGVDSFGTDQGFDVAVDPSGSAYVVGLTDSTDFPTTPGAYRTSITPGEFVSFVAKLSPSGSALVYATYIGGTTTTHGSIEVDAAGSAYVAGDTFGAYPTTPGAFDTTPSGSRDVFLTKLTPGGDALAYSTFLGNGRGGGLELDASGNAYVTGDTFGGFPTTSGAYDTTLGGGQDAFVTKVAPTGASLVYSTFLGGSETYDEGSDIAVDSAGSAYVTGLGGSHDFPTTPGAFMTSPTIGGAFVTKLNPGGTGLVYSTWLAANRFRSFNRGIAVDQDGRAYVTGEVIQQSFQATSLAHDSTYNGGDDAYVMKLSPNGSSLDYATYLGGTASEYGKDIAVDAQGQAFVVGTTYSSDYPLAAPADSTFNDSEAFLTKLTTPVSSGLVRPKGATPARFSLAIAYRQCTDANEIHGPPLAYGSCAGPEMMSNFLTVGTADANARPALNEGYVRFDVAVGNPSTVADEADVRLEMFSDDVFTKTTLTDYAGELRAAYNLRITDRNNSTGGGPAEPGTTVEVPLGASFACAPSADPNEGSACSGTTSVDAITPGAVQEGKRSIWQLDRVRVFDGGADGDGDTVSDNTLFATAGLFVP